MAKSFSPKNTLQTYSNLELMDYLVQTLGLDPTGSTTILSLLGGVTIPSNYQNESVNNTPVQIGGSLVSFYGYNFYNPNSYDVFIKFWDYTHLIPPTPGGNNPNLTLQVPCLASIVVLGNQPFLKTLIGNSLWYCATKGYLATDGTAIASNVLSTIFYTT